MANQLISSENLSQESIYQLFDNAYLDIEKKDDAFKIKDNFVVWIDLDENRRYIKFSSYFKRGSNMNANDMATYLNKVNTEYIMVRAAASDQLVVLTYYLWVEKGVTARNVISTYKFFDSVLIDSALREDQNNIIG